MNTNAKTAVAASIVIGPPLGTSLHGVAVSFNAILVSRADTGFTKLPKYLALRIDPGAMKLVQILHHDHLPLHAHQFRDFHHLASAVGQARDVHDDVERGGYL